MATEFNVGRGTVAFGGSVMIGLMLFFAPLTGLLLDRPGSLPTVLTFAGGGVVIGLSLLAASYAESFAVAAVCFAFAGLGLSCCGPHSATIVQVRCTVYTVYPL